MAVVLLAPAGLRAAPGVVVEVEDEAPPSAATTPGVRAAPGVVVEVEDEAPATAATPPGVVVEEAPPTDATTPTGSDVAALVRDNAALRAELAGVRGRVQAIEAARANELAEQTAAENGRGPIVRTTARAEVPPISTGFGPGYGVAARGVRLSGYVQTQYLWNQLSEDQIQQGGAPLNRNSFMVRRGRVRVSGDWRFLAFDLELDGSTTRGPFVSVRQASVSVLWRSPDATRPPYMMLTAGLTEAPFGHELRLGQREMLFMERTRGSLAFFPGPVDVGLRLRGGIGVFRYDVAVMNGTPLDDRAGGRGLMSEPTAAPDYMGRVGFEARPRRHAIGGGVSLLHGTGFHRGEDATKDRVEWQDLNENGSLDTGELIPIPGTAAIPSYTFRRWAVGADLQIGLRSRAGWSQIWLEATLASNLDRDLVVADPIAAGADLREVHAYAAFLQELFNYAVIGARYDLYDPNSDLLDARRGGFVPASAAIHTFSPIVAAVLPAGVIPYVRARLVLQYDAVLDALGRDARGVPANLKNDQFVVRAQVEF